jgi:DNA polymerase IIIc chi subunit
LALNKEDGGNRKFILVECEDYADKVTAERVRRVIKGVPNAKDAAFTRNARYIWGGFCSTGNHLHLINRNLIVKTFDRC